MKKIEIEVPEGKRAEWVNGVLTLVDDTPKEPNEVIKCWHDACEYFGLIRKNFTEYAHVYRPYLEATEALNKLFLIAEAWNKIDGFVPDFSNRNQRKYFPWFIYNDDAAGFVFAYTHAAPPSATAPFGHKLCFKTASRAEQFGKQFIDLFNKVFLP